MPDKEPAFDDAAEIARLNDEFRQTFEGGRVVMTSGVQALSQLVQFRALQAIQNFDDFTPDSDPYGHHDFGEVQVDSHRIWFKHD